jgi:predicted MFS family arabinose efflux permease
VAKDNYRWVMLAVISLYGLSQSFTVQSVPPVLSLMIEDFGISHAEAGLSMSFCGVGGMFLILPLSLYLHRIGSKKVGIVSLALNVIGVALAAVAPNLPVFLAGRVIQGISAAALALVGTQQIARWFVNHRPGLAMGIYTIVFPLSGVIALTTFGAIGIAWGWRTVMWLVFAVNVSALVLFVIYYKTPPEHSDGTTSNKILPVRALFKIGWPIWVLAATWGFASLCNTAIGTFTPDFLYQSGFDLRIAGAVSGIILMCGLFIGPLSGYVSDRIRYKEAIIIAGALVSCAVLFMLPIDINRVILYMILLGIFSAPFAPITLSMAATLVKHDLMPLAFAAVATWSAIGMTVGPYVSGLIRDVSGSYQYSYWFVSILFLVVALLMSFLLARRVKLNRAAAARLKQ